MAAVRRTRLHDEVARLMRDARVSAGVEQAELAARVGRAQSWVSKIETRERRVDLVDLFLFAHALGVGVETLVAGMSAYVQGDPSGWRKPPRGYARPRVVGRSVRKPR